MKTLLQESQMRHGVISLAKMLMNFFDKEKKIYIIGVQPRGVFLSDRIIKYIYSYHKDFTIEYGKLDITLYRDDVRQGMHNPSQTNIMYSLDKKNIVLVDDVLYTGRTIRAAMDALMDFGRLNKIKLMVMINRKDTRELPIQPDFFVEEVEKLHKQKVLVHWKEKHGVDEVIIK